MLALVLLVMMVMVVRAQGMAAAVLVVHFWGTCSRWSHVFSQDSVQYVLDVVLSIFLFQVQFSGRGWLLRFLALLWTTPSSSSFTIDTQLTGSLSFTVSPLLQARGLQIAAAYLTSLDVQSLVAICTTKCPRTYLHRCSDHHTTV